MTVTLSSRLGLTRWSDESDPFTRSQMDAAHAALDTLAAIDVQDVLANRPAPGVRGRFFTETAASAGLPGTTWREDGSSWRSVGSRVVAGSATDVGRVTRGAALQSGDLEQLQNSAGTVLSRFDSTGALFAPAATIAGSPVLTTASSLAWGKLTGVPSLVNTVAGRSGAVALTTSDISGLSSASVGFASSAGSVPWSGVTGVPSLVNTVAGRSGAVTLTTSDIGGLSTASVGSATTAGSATNAGHATTADSATVADSANAVDWANVGNKPLTNIRGGQATVTFTSGAANLAHGLGGAPVGAVVTSVSGGGTDVIIMLSGPSSSDATNLKLRAVTVSTATNFSGSATFTWMAFR